MEDTINNNIYIKDFIKERLDYFDYSNNKFKHLIKILPENVTQDKDKQTITFKDKDIEIYKGNYTLLGIFDLNTKIWIWSWVTPYFTSKETIQSRDILNYGLNLEPESNSLIHFYLKNHFISSRLYFETDIALNIHLALSLYITKNKFIYSIHKKDLNLIQYFIIK
jgi:hypothetical protein